jgi:hypothetical protein
MPEVQEFVQQHNLENHVRLPGFLNHNDYLREMQQADIFLHPSVTAANGDTEGGHQRRSWRPRLSVCRSYPPSTPIFQMWWFPIGVPCWCPNAIAMH